MTPLEWPGHSSTLGHRFTRDNLTAEFLTISHAQRRHLMAEPTEKIEVDEDSRLLLRQLAVESKVSMLVMFRVIVREAWERRPEGRRKDPSQG